MTVWTTVSDLLLVTGRRGEDDVEGDVVRIVGGGAVGDGYCRRVTNDKTMLLGNNVRR